ncbi:polymer-forming cytoskeletal protein [Patescibacteria group bacterium]|nr:MAG: polymer-forming cytoskeletal protein [Patescibacteria group bacterium]
MFKQRLEGGAGDTVIAGGVKVEGDFVSEGNVIIEGEVVGSLRTARDLQVGDAAKIHADVAATNARVAGEVRGNVVIKEKLELASSSRIFGDVQAKILTVEAGAQLNGKIHMGEAPAEATSKSERNHAERTTAGGLSALVGNRVKAEKASAN